MKNETNIYFLERTIEVEYKIRIQKEEEKYFAYVYDELSQDTRKVECWIEDDYTGSLMTEECNTEEEYDSIIDSFKAFILANGTRYARVCDKCNEGMNEGYLVGNGDEYYCSPECLHQVYTPKQWQEMYDESEENGGNDNYWTQWDDDDDYNYVFFNNQLINI